MFRKIIKIDADKCDGCGLCVNACHEGAIGLKDGKAFLRRDDYCDGLGDCLPACPTGAISFEEREALPFNEKLVHLENPANTPCGCPGSRAVTIERENNSVNVSGGCNRAEHAEHIEETPSQLRQWPVQIQLAPIGAQYFNNADLLIAADCAAYAYGAFHDTFMKDKVTLIGCPKLDKINYAEKLEAILLSNTIKSVTVVRMEVPCCGGLESAVKTALKNSGKMIPWQVITISTDGKILRD